MTICKLLMSLFSDYTFLPIQKIILTLGILNSFVIYMWMFRLWKFSCKVQLMIIIIIFHHHHYFFFGTCGAKPWFQSLLKTSFMTWKPFNPLIMYIVKVTSFILESIQVFKSLKKTGQLALVSGLEKVG